MPPIELIWDLYLRQPFEHQSDEANIDLSCGIVQGSLKVFEQAFTSLKPACRLTSQATGIHWVLVAGDTPVS
ncbi:MAG: hypothetical protein ACYTX0_40520 [Nostoc sp.]